MNLKPKYYVFYGNQYWGEVTKKEVINLPDGSYYGPLAYILDGKTIWRKKGYAGNIFENDLPNVARLLYSLLPK